MQGTRLLAVDTEDEPRTPLGLSVPRETSSERTEHALTGLLLTTLRTLSQKTVVALASLVDLALIGSVFALCLLIVKEPSALQLVEAAGYAVFIGVSLWLRRR
jgi:hypothetical protein